MDRNDMYNQCKSINGKYRCIKRIGHKREHKDFYGNNWELKED